MRALAAGVQSDPLHRAVELFELTPLELQLFLLALAPELDLRYQRCIGLLLDDLGRRCGTMGLYATLLGEPLPVRQALARSDRLARWRVLDAPAGELPPADEPLRVDPALVGWLLGSDGSLRHDRLVGASGVLRSLIDRGALGLVTTHDLALTAIADNLTPHAANVHFEEWFDAGEMRFDYRLKPGRVTRSNALALMRAVGLEVDTDG